IEQGRVEDALRWAQEAGLSADDELTYVREYEHVTLARALLVDEPGRAVPFLERLLAAAEEGGRLEAVTELRELLSGAAAPSRRAQPLVDPLSERELDVLRLLRTDLSGPDIAKELYVSLNTLRTHTKRIYTKLGVTSRREAVTRADELGL
ncbi:MAG TPA: LuxR C-terminal-related transcriptional regulator, partial [Acidimicrobiales bacterium]|nr:LuxR C-terminal-related transcriptional regulator [Acidimicrobiales bacterium]